jgi:hypothetical protein
VAKLESQPSQRNSGSFDNFRKLRKSDERCGWQLITIGTVTAYFAHPLMQVPTLCISLKPRVE